MAENSYSCPGHANLATLKPSLPLPLLFPSTCCTWGRGGGSSPLDVRGFLRPMPAPPKQLCLGGPCYSVYQWYATANCSTCLVSMVRHSKFSKPVYLCLHTFNCIQVEKSRRILTRNIYIYSFVTTPVMASVPGAPKAQCARGQERVPVQQVNVQCTVITALGPNCL